MSAEIKEIISQARKQKMIKFWQSHKKEIISGVAVLSFAFLTSAIYGIYKKDKQEKYSAMLQEATISFDIGDVENAKKITKEIYEDNGAAKNVRALASLKYASILLDENNLDEAIKVYLKISELRGSDIFFRELAGLEALKIMIDSGDEKYFSSITDLAAKLEKNSKVLQYFVLEQKAIFEINRNNYKIAGEILKEIAESKDKNISASLKARAVDLLGICNSKNPNLVKEFQQN